MQDGSIKKHGKWWVLKYRITVAPYVNRKGKTATTRDEYKKLALIDRDHQTKKSVEALARETLVPVNLTGNQVQSTDSLETFLQGFLLKGEGGKGRRLRKSTLKSYHAVFNMLKPYLGGLELRKVGTPDVDLLLRKAATGEQAQTTCNNMKHFLGSAFRYATRMGLVRTNPVRDAAVAQGVKADTRAYSLPEIKTILNAVKSNHVVHALLTMFAFTALRKSEMKGLRWEDYKNGALYIQRTIVEDEVEDVKTEASRAAVPVPPIVKKALAEHLKKNSGDGYIFHGESSELPMHFENLARRVIKPMLTEAGIEWHGYHAFRRGVATDVYEEQSEQAAADALRHEDSRVTKKHYIKIKKATKRTVTALENREAQFRKLR